MASEEGLYGFGMAPLQERRPRRELFPQRPDKAKARAGDGAPTWVFVTQIIK
ncbi:hypothetical protein [Pseudoxanthomonas sp. UTMC 1351]|uniref:hypothetical protein n=1 Tax=Pseudoxanthomonas sp. UTMC 1351 TaxID=2695853 RepID=UPI0034CD3720